ncbi:hypothetical protein EV286_105219 [Rhizobium sp. BK251]|nr:hypothetical protein EV286_105219 [Rhizobium sp. BK251]
MTRSISAAVTTSTVAGIARAVAVAKAGVNAAFRGCALFLRLEEEGNDNEAGRRGQDHKQSVRSLGFHGSLPPVRLLQSQVNPR